MWFEGTAYLCALHRRIALGACATSTVKVHDKQLVLFVCAISDIDQLNSYWIQEYLNLIIVA